MSRKYTGKLSDAFRIRKPTTYQYLCQKCGALLGLPSITAKLCTYCGGELRFQGVVTCG